MQSEDLEITEQNTGSATLVKVRGGVHVKSSPDLRNTLQRILKMQPKAVVVNLDQASRVDASGLATLVECAQVMSRQAGKLLVSGLNEQKTDALSLEQVKALLHIFGSGPEALEHLKETS